MAGRGALRQLVRMRGVLLERVVPSARFDGCRLAAQAALASASGAAATLAGAAPLTAFGARSYASDGAWRRRRAAQQLQLPRAVALVQQQQRRIRGHRS